VRLSVLAFAGNASLGQSEPVSLQWGKVFSLFACGDNARPRLVWVENKIDTNL
jgi:alginate O-acetyltransferase complex protein AlgF